MKSNPMHKTLGAKKLLALAIPLLAATQAQAFEFNMGEVEGRFDSQISMGSSWRVESQDESLLTNVDGESSNSDDANKNYQSGDTFSEVFKANHELEFNYQNFGGFIRGKYWYDSALANNSVDYGHSATLDNDGAGGEPVDYNHPNETLDDSDFNDLSKAKGATLLDAYIYGAFDINDMALDIRLGRQVISWGESTFIRGGVNIINPVDAVALTRPGAEIKEGLLPVNMAYANVGLTDNLSAEAFYQLEFQETVIPACGTYFSSNDYVSDGCNTISVADGQTSVARDENGVRKASDTGQYGLAFRYIAEDLGNTEFGLYALNVHSRTPIVNVNRHDVDGAEQSQIAQTGIAQFSALGAPTMAALGFNSVQEYVTALTINAFADNTTYFVEYPEDVQVLGLSFSSNIGSVAVSGELSHTLDQPVQINGPMLVAASLTGQSTSTQLTEQMSEVPLGGDISGADNFDISQIQFTVIKTFDQVLGANQMTLIGEAGYTFINSFEEGDDATKYGRSDIFGTFGENADGSPNPGNVDDGFVTEDSWGYRARLEAKYINVFSGTNITPTLSWSEDVSGYAPQPGGNFNEGQQSIGFSVEATYLESYTANLSYTQYMGGDYSLISDHDYASMSLGMQF